MASNRNIAIIAHVDHGKTTLIDKLLAQCGAFRTNQEVAERAMDSNDLERERGITILAKCTSLEYRDININIIDTPGHADFGGEVERVLSMVDSVIVLVDAAEGPMTQTKFVLSKALALGLKPIVVVNKIDRSDARITEVIDEIYELFMALEATEEQLDFPIIYASGRSGWAVKELADPRENLGPLLDCILDYAPNPQNIDPSKPFSMLVTMIEVDPYLGKILIGKIYNGTVKQNDIVQILDTNAVTLGQGRIAKLMVFKHLSKHVVESAGAGDIVAIAGLPNATVSHTICDPSVTERIYAKPIDPPTLSMTFSINDSPLAGTEGTKVTSRLILQRLLDEQESNISIKVEQLNNSDAFSVSARGELQLGILIENMRREGFELSISRPQVVLKKDEITGALLEPYEEVVVDVDDEFSGIVIEKLGAKRAEMLSMLSSGAKTRLTFCVPSRYLIGYHGEFLTDTRGTGVLNRIFLKYDTYKGEMRDNRNGVLVSTEPGEAVAYALFNIEDRGIIFIKPGDKLYKGMIIGENSRDQDLHVNPIKGKQLSNVRSVNKDEAVRLTPPKVMTLEAAITYIQDDELVEVTPKSIRLRKKISINN